MPCGRNEMFGQKGAVKSGTQEIINGKASPYPEFLDRIGWDGEADWIMIEDHIISDIEEENRAPVVSGAHMKCSLAKAPESCMTVYAAGESFEERAGGAALKATDIAFDQGELGECRKYRLPQMNQCVPHILDGCWQACCKDEITGEESVIMSSYLLCERRRDAVGILTLVDDGQVPEEVEEEIVEETEDEITFNQDLYENNVFYRATAEIIKEIEETDEWDEELREIREAYLRNKPVYEEISRELANGVVDKNSGEITIVDCFPPEVIGAIHYRENAADYLAGGFEVYLHNGDELGKVSEKKPEPPFFGKGEFKEAAIDALRGWDEDDYYIENRARSLGLTSDSKDFTAMLALTLLYNGWDREENPKPSYGFNKTNVHLEGTYTSDGTYEEDAVDANLGTYWALKAILDL